MAGLYRPSSGTEGEWFIGKWCARCERDKFQNGSKSMDDCAPEDLCHIVGNTMFLSIDDPGYPHEWVTDDEGPRCTAFIDVVRDVPAPRCAHTVDMFHEGSAPCCQQQRIRRECE